MEEAKIFGDEDDFVGLDDPVQRDVLGQGPATSKYQASALRSMKSSHIQKVRPVRSDSTLQRITQNSES